MTVFLWMGDEGQREWPLAIFCIGVFDFCVLGICDDCCMFTRYTCYGSSSYGKEKKTVNLH